jgi:hypothetical protein
MLAKLAFGASTNACEINSTGCPHLPPKKNGRPMDGLRNAFIRSFHVMLFSTVMPVT